MRWYHCDECEKIERSDPTVRVKGVSVIHGIRIPSNLVEKTFCCIKCFWAWADRNKPNF